ncbi:MAG: hypothetical protein K940chlam9_01869 [Chlamydiae bacterium]|nr:hypothetical protein [Chlamydiota bacterium]
MFLPNSLKEKIYELTEGISPAQLREASEEITSIYRKQKSLARKEALLAYLVVRLPATYGATKQVLTEAASFCTPASLLDLGGGPGTTSWAAREIWGENLAVTSIEKHPSFIELGKALQSPTDWLCEDVTHLSTFPPHDLIVYGYSFGELNEPNLLSLAWEAASQGVILVEPGTPAGYQNILKARDHLIELGGFVAAPCPHNHPCPLSPPDWCHFAARISRSQLHMVAKEGSLPFEDEKYSYLIVLKKSLSHNSSRILRPPDKKKGHIELSLCTPQGTNTLLTLTKRKDRERYSQARKASWGSTI